MAGLGQGVKVTKEQALVSGTYSKNRARYDGREPVDDTPLSVLSPPDDLTTKELQIWQFYSELWFFLKVTQYAKFELFVRAKVALEEKPSSEWKSAEVSTLAGLIRDCSGTATQPPKL